MSFVYSSINTMTKLRDVYVWVVVGVTLLSLYVILMSNSDDNVGERYSLFSKESVTRIINVSDLGPPFDKWIVVTTIFSPTDDVKFLTKIPGWKVVVVGDKKTPTNWSSPNCIFLDIKSQQHLGFETVNLLPTGSYARKTMGYLYAIARGAKIIYETDDDNRPLDLLQNFILQPQTSGIMFAGKNIFNPYRHFGQPTLWPRGYPLNAIGDNISYNYVLQTWKTPSIQQGVVNGDPDMDAIFRLTRKKTSTMLNITFDTRAPPGIVPTGVFSPFNSQNTLFLYDSLWALLIPTTSTIRVCDIWRGYWAQRLLWEMGGTLGFLPPNAFQKRNSHSYLDDAVQEKDIYFETTRLVSFLTQWTCHSNASFFSCVHRLSEDMAKQNFWKADDVKLTKTWLKDLLAAGYKEPTRVQPKPQNQSYTFPKGYSEKQTLVDFWPVEQTIHLPHTLKIKTDPMQEHVYAISRFCPKTALLQPQYKMQQTFPIYSNILLIIEFKIPNYENMKLLEIIYSMYFPQRLYCGPQIDKFRNITESFQQHVTFLELNKKGYYEQRCMVEAMLMNYNVDGYLYVADDTLLNVWNLKSLPVHRIWFTNYLPLLNGTGARPLIRKNNDVGESAYLAAINELKLLDMSRYNKFTKILQANRKLNDSFYYQSSGVVYLPSRFKQMFITFNKIFLKYNIYLEIGFETFIAGVESANNIVLLKGKYLSHNELMTHIEEHFNKTEHFLHPVKANQEFYCETYLPLTLPGIKI